MNGRVYDPQIGRFLSADTYIQDPYNTQSYNRYSYVVNNPLKYTDPTGNFFGLILGIISAVATDAVIAVLSAELLLAQMIIAYAVTYSVTYIATGSGKAAQGAGLSAALFMGIGGLRGGKMGANGKMQYNPGWESGSMKTLAAHGLAGGIVQDRMGGSFGAGFLSGSLGSYLGSSGHSKNMFEMIGNTARDAVVGGTISVIGGGKFANGAQTGAFRYLFNEWTHAGQTIIKTTTSGFNKESWRRVKSNYLRGEPLKVDSTKIAVEMRNNATLPWYQQRISVSVSPINADGSLLMSVAESFSTSYWAFTGLAVSRVVVFDVNMYSRWTVSTSSIQKFGSVSHEWFNIYIPK